mmetsp:Transcript_40062/g.96723  ORF Transcript_40062/g.96723 Transcript_40062/m.96723 type:complete len:252 (+) Transcript_40062:117-872(+)|eukprot:CAMPEP_0113624718 /NCGR_PEP_ID=MMETSP0017_2-20120614/12751_1 /TAXON_ID=2856 /ORGANISM="Cylindrotheca closterium" /LENGTH=251 /DNA_ID=CAMNT_0000534775 /DNA_START=96 /DNA_END=851 /DNA_ORIENTATION=+ /assembly_acc=CAM_ASM_000147
MIRQYALSIFLLLSAVGNISAFTPAMSTRSLASVSPIVPPLFMSEEPEASAEEPAPEETVEEEVPEDPELTALKQEIANLESELKAKQSTLSYTQSQVDEYSKGGYARKVAEMETMRRVRSSMNSSNRSSATASVLAEFLPLYDKFVSMKEQYAHTEFGSKYGSLSIEDTFAKMGATEYSLEAGQDIDAYRMAAVESEYSTEIAKDMVIRQVAPGLEMEGNVIRAAQCVVSAGSEEEAAAVEAAPEAGEEE